MERACETTSDLNPQTLESEIEISAERLTHHAYPYKLC